MRKLRGKVAFVTGAGSGIGRASALAFAREGMHVVVTDVDAGRADAVAQEIGELGGKALDLALDVTDSAAVETAAKDAIAWDGGVHLVMNNAGIMVGGHVQDLTLEDWRRAVDVNLMGVVHGVHAFVPHLLGRGSGHVVNTASMLGLITMPWIAPYVATKFAVVGITEALRAELAGAGVGVTCLCPGAVGTRFMPDSSWTRGASKIRDFIDRKGVTPEKVAARVVRAVRKNEGRVLVGADAYVITAIHRLSPTLYGRNLAAFGRKGVG